MCNADDFNDFDATIVSISDEILEGSYIVAACKYIDLLLPWFFLPDLRVSTTVSSTTTSTLTMSTVPAASSGLTAVTTTLLSSTAGGEGYDNACTPQYCQVLCMFIVPVQLPQLHSYDSFE